MDSSIKKTLFLFFISSLLFSCNKELIIPENAALEKTPKMEVNAFPIYSVLTGRYIKKADDREEKPMPQTVHVYVEDETYKILLKDKVYELLYSGNTYYLSTKEDTPYKPNTLARVEIFQEIINSPTPVYRVNLVYWDRDSKTPGYTNTIGATYKRVESD